MTTEQTPAVQRRRLRVTLRAARQHAELTQDEVARRLYWSPSKLLRIENGKNGISVTDLKALLDVYGIRDEHRIGELVELAHGAKRQSWARYKGVVTKEFLTLLSYETAARHIKVFENVLIPGELQTEEYARASIRALSSEEDNSADVINRRVQLRLERQDVLLQGGGPQIHVVVDEAAARRHVGGADAMIRQLEHLRELGRHPNIVIQFLPFAVREHPGMRGPFRLLEFPDPQDDPLLYVENARGDILERDDAEETTTYQEIFLALTQIATPPKWLDATLDRIIAQIRDEAPGHTGAMGAGSRAA